MSSTLEASVLMGKNYSKIYIPSKIQKISQWNRWFDISEKLISEQSDETYGVNTNNLVILQENIYLWLVMKKSSVSLARKGLRIFRFCVMLEREPTICMRRQVDVVQKFITKKTFGHNWWWANGIQVEYLPRIHHIAARPWSPRVTCQKWAYNQKISLDGLSSCRCSTTSHGDLKTMNRNANQVLSSFLSIRKDF